MPAICTLCANRPMAVLADGLINAGRSTMGVAKVVGLDRNVVRRHINNGHVVPLVPVAAEDGATMPSEAGRTGLRGTGGTPASSSTAAASSLSAEDLLKSVIDGLDVDLDTVSPRDRLNILAERRRAASDLARIGRPVAAVDDGRPTWAQMAAMREAEYVALRNFPEARHALSQAHRKVLGLPPGVPYPGPAKPLNPHDFDGGAGH